MLLLVEEILHHLGSMKPCKQWDKNGINYLLYQLVQDSFPSIVSPRLLQIHTTTFSRMRNSVAPKRKVEPSTTIAKKQVGSLYKQKSPPRGIAAIPWYSATIILLNILLSKYCWSLSSKSPSKKRTFWRFETTSVIRLTWATKKTLLLSIILVVL